MRTTWITWLLGGALLASVSWNMRPPTTEVAPEPEPLEQSGACGEVCAIETPELGLDEDRTDELRGICETSCERARRLDTEAREAFEELVRDLANDSLAEEDLDERVRVIAELRVSSVEACVKGLSEARELLSREEWEQLLDCCGL